MRTIIAASLLILLAAVACGEEAWDVDEKREFTGTGSTWPDKHVSLYLPEGRYSVEPSSNLKTDELAYVDLFRVLTRVRWDWEPSIGSNFIYVTWGSNLKLFPGGYELRVPALAGESWAVTITKTSD